MHIGKANTMEDFYLYYDKQGQNWIQSSKVTGCLFTMRHNEQHIFGVAPVGLWDLLVWDQPSEQCSISGSVLVIGRELMTTLW